MAHMEVQVRYWDRVVQSMELVVYDAAYRKRLERIKRMKEKNFD